MTPPRSRALARLDAAIAAAAHPIEARCLRAERAGLLARQGQIDPARAAVDELTTQLAWQPSPALRGWLALADGGHRNSAGLIFFACTVQAAMLSWGYAHPLRA